MYTWKEGVRYSGYYHDGKKHGLGIKTYPDKSINLGTYFQGKKHGLGLKSKEAILWENDKCIKKFSLDEL